MFEFCVSDGEGTLLHYGTLDNQTANALLETRYVYFNSDGTITLGDNSDGDDGYEFEPDIIMQFCTPDCLTGQ